MHTLEVDQVYIFFQEYLFFFNSTFKDLDFLFVQLINILLIFFFFLLQSMTLGESTAKRVYTRN